MDPRTLRPRRRWYAFSAVVAVVFIAAGIGAGYAYVAKAEGSIPDFHATYPGNTDTEVHFEAEREYALYLADDAHETCAVHYQRTKVPGSSAISFSRDGEEWVLASRLVFGTSKTYTVNCDASKFAIGDPPNSYWDHVGTATGLLVSLPPSGVAIGVGMALVTAVLRHAHKRRLLSTPAG